jgi:protein disulfide-isomerase-like protein
MLWCSSPDRLRCIHRHFLWHLLTLSLSIIQGFAVSRALYADQSPVVRLTDDNFRRLVLDSSETWLVEFYAPWCGHCRSLAPNWEKAARRLNGLVRVGAVDCEQNRALAQEYNIQAFPTIKLFTGRKRTTERRQPLDYHGGRSLKDIVRFARRSLVGYVHTVDPSGVDAFLREESSKGHVLLVTTNQRTSAIYRALSERHVDRALFGVMRLAAHDEASMSALLKRLGAQPRLPAVIGVPAGADLDSNTVLVLNDREKMSIRALDDLVRQLVNKTNRQPTTKPTATANIEKRSSTTAQATGNSWHDLFGNECTARDSVRLCVILAQPELEKLVDALNEKYVHDGVHVAMREARVLRSRLKLAPNTLALVIRPRKQRIAVLEHDVVNALPAADGISAFIDRALGGDLRYRPLSDLLEPSTDATRDEL